MIPCSLLLRSVRCFQRRNISKKQSVTDILRQTVLFKRIISNLLAFLNILFFILFLSIFPLYFYRYERACVFSSSFFPFPVPMMLKRTFVFTLVQRGFLHPGGRGALGYFLGRFVPPGTPNWHRAWKASGTQGTELPAPWLNDNKKFCPVLFTFSSPWPPYDTERSLGRKENRSTEP